jgi:hypothetical protein
MSPLRLTGSTSGYSQIDAPAVAGDQLFTLPGTGGTLDRLNRAGNVLQVVNATYSTTTSSSSSTYADTGLTATITPTSSSSKILVLVNQCGLAKNNNSWLSIRLLRGSTPIITFDGQGGYTGTTTYNSPATAGTCYLDSPSTTSAVTYKTQLCSVINNAIVWVQIANEASTITLLEVAA